MGKNSCVLWLMSAFILEKILWKAVETEDVKSLQRPVLKHCNLTTQAAALFPFSHRFLGSEALYNKLQVTLENTNFAPGIDGKPGGALTLKGRSDSFIEIAYDEQVDFQRSMTMLIFIYPFSSHTGPIVNYKADGYGVQMWSQGTVGPKGGLMVRFNRRSLGINPSWVKKDVLNIEQWNFIGASYDDVTGYARLFHDGEDVRASYIGRNLELATQFEIRLGAVSIKSLGSFHGKVACLQFYSQALSVDEVRAAMVACGEVVPLEFLNFNITPSSLLVEANETELSVRAVVNDNATSPNFQFDFGDGTGIQRSTSSTGNHIYRRIGNFTVQVEAWGLCNSGKQTAVVDVIVPKPVHLLKNLSLHCQDNVFGETSRFVLKVGQGSDFHCLWFLSDGVNYSTPVMSLTMAHLNHTFPTPANYTAFVKCHNRRSSETAFTSLAVQTKIEGLKISPITPRLFGAEFQIKWQTNSGSDIWYTAKIDGEFLQVVQSKDERHAHVQITKDHYKTAGKFSVLIAASNAVTGTVSATAKFKVVRRVMAFIPTVCHKERDIEINETIVLWLTEANSVADINATFIVDFGDGSISRTTRETKIGHAYLRQGIYLVNVTALNEVSQYFANISIEVQKPALKLKIWKFPSSVAVLNKTIALHLFFIQGSDFICHWRFGDGEDLIQDLREELVYFENSNPDMLQFINISASVSHVFSCTGVHKVNVSCRNRLSEVETETQVIVEEEIKFFRVTSIDPVTFGNDFFINWTIAAGTNVSFKVFLGHQKLSFVKEKSQYVSMVTPSIYHHAGEFEVIITASNLVTPLLRHSQKVIIEIPVSRAYVSINYREGGGLYPGHGKKKNTFPGSLPVVFNVVTDNGSNLQFSWKINGVATNFGNNPAERTFNKAGFYVITGVVENYVSRVIIRAVFEVQKRATFLHEGLHCTTPNLLNERVKIKINVEQVGTNATLTVAFENGTALFYGDHHDYTSIEDSMTNRTVKYAGELKKNLLIHQVYSIPGSYRINATLANDVSRSFTTCDVEVLPRPCKIPTVRMKNAGRIAEEAGKFFTSDPVEIRTVIDIFCPGSKKSRFLWNIWRYNAENSSLGLYNGVFVDDNAYGPELRLERRVLPVGLYKLSLTVGLVDEQFEDYTATAEGFILIQSSQLVAEIAGGSEIRRGMGSVIVANGTGSYDPDVGRRNHTGMEFIWLCRNVSENFPNHILDIINNSGKRWSEYFTRRTTNSSITAAGCYRDGHYVLSNTTSLRLNTTNMFENETYEVTLVIRKHKRMSFTSQTVELGPKHIPELTIRCAVNCGLKVNPSEKLSLMTECKGSACSDNLMFSWDLFVSDNHNDERPMWRCENRKILPNSPFGSFSNFPNIVIPKGTFDGNKHYKMDFHGHLPDGSYGRASYMFYVNSPPSRGRCNVHPREGHVLTTQFKFQCTDWLDSDTPLMYEFVHVYEDGESLLSFGDESNKTLELPLGDGNDYTLNVMVRVSDRMGASAVVRLQVRSLPSLFEGTELMTEISSMTTGNSSVLHTLAMSGRSQDVARVVGSTSSLLNQQAASESGSAELLVLKRKQLRTSLIMMMSQQKTTSPQSVSLVSRSLYQATEHIREVSLQAQEACTSSLSNMAKVLDRESGTGSVEHSAGEMYGTIGNLLGATADTLSIDRHNDTKAEWIKSKSMVKNLLAILDSVATSVLRTKLPFEKATEFYTPRLTANLKSAAVADISGEVSLGAVRFKLPQGKDMFHTEDSVLTAVNQKVFSMPRNIFTHHESARDVTTLTVSLSYSNKDNQQALHVDNLKNYIEFFLPSTAQLPEPDTFSINLTETSWSYHKLVSYSEDQAISIEVIPLNCSHELTLLVRENIHPTKEHFRWKKAIRKNSTKHGNPPCFEEHLSYTMFLPNTETRVTTYFIGVWYEEGEKQEYLPGADMQPVYYSIRTYTTKCLYWNELQGRWMGDGCMVGPLTSTERIHCMTNHLTSFGSGLFVAPNPIDFKQVMAGFAVAFETGNVTVLFTILTLLLIYAVVAIWARRRDKKDIIQIGATVLPLSEVNCQFRYEISFVTGSRNGSGTSAHIGCEIFGESGRSGPLYLLDSKRPLFRRGDLNAFIACLPASVGVIRGLRVWHDNSGKRPSWFFNRAMLRDCQSGEKYLFLAGRWLSVTEEDGKVDVTLRPANEEDMVSFKKLFNSRLHLGICDKHLWFSVAYRPSRSPFTRLQRVSCCLSLLFSFMVATAMFYGSGPQPGDSSNSVQLGPITLNWHMIVIGIQSALVAIPINILIVAFFRNSRAKPRQNSRSSRDFIDSLTSDESQVNDETESTEGERENSTHEEKELDVKDIDCGIEGNTTGQHEMHVALGEGHSCSSEEKLLAGKTKSSQDEEALKNPKQGLMDRVREKLSGCGGSSTPCFPYWCVYVGWALCIATAIVSAAFTLFYSMMWGKEKSELWLTTMLISFIQDTLISQPIKVIIIALVYALIIKSPDDDLPLESALETLGPEEDPLHEAFYQDSADEKLRDFHPPDKRILNETRIRELKRQRTIKLFTDLCMYVVLLAMIVILSAHYRNPDSYKMIDTLRRTFGDPSHNSSHMALQQVTRVGSIWNWTRQTLLPALFPDPLYSGHKIDPYLGDRVSLQIGVARLRQVRIEKDTCEVNPWFQNIISECNHAYSFTDEDSLFYLPQWKNATEKPKKENGNMFSFLSTSSDYVHSPWEHKNPFEAHHVLPVIGKFATYSGGGYAIDFNQSLEQTDYLIQQQQDLLWLDRYTRAVHAEFVAYNPTLNMVAAVTITFEIPPFGAVFTNCEVFTLSLYGSLRKHRAARTVGEIIAALVLIVMIIRVALTMFHDKCTYFKDTSKLLDLVLVLTGVVIVFLKVIREGFKMLATDQFKSNTKQFLDFYQCGFYDELTDYALALLVFIAIVRFAVFLKFLSCWEHLLKTMSRCLREFLACLFVFFCLLMAYISLFTLALESDSKDYKDFSSSMQSAISHSARMIPAKEIRDSNRSVKALVVFSSCVTFIYFYINLLRVVFIEAHKKTLNEDSGNDKRATFESGIIEIFVDKFLEITGMEKDEPLPLEKEEDMYEVMLKCQEKYVVQSQFVRLRNLLNTLYSEDFADDIELFQKMNASPENTNNNLEMPLDSLRQESGITLANIEVVVEELPELVGKEVLKGSQLSQPNDERFQVKFNLAPQTEPVYDKPTQPTKTQTASAADDSLHRGTAAENLVPLPPKDGGKLMLLEKLVQEKIRDLEHEKRNHKGATSSSSSSLEHDIQMLLNLQQRIRAKKYATASTSLSKETAEDQR